MNSFIYAPATPPIVSALSIIRLSGSGVFGALGKCFSKPLGAVAKRGIYVGYIKDGDREIDQVVLLLYKAPRSYTGEDMAEIICHGSPLLVGEICGLLEVLGGRLAERGEFTSLAYYNGKIDLVQAEAVNDLINARTEGAAELAIKSVKGEASALAKSLRDKTAELLASLEVGIDYPEYEDIAKTETEDVAAKCGEILKELEGLIAGSKGAHYVSNGINVALVGAPNVGKSSLLNAILGKDKAIVSDTPGTTRDIVEGERAVAGILYRFYDTAGLRKGEGEIEEKGIGKSLEAIKDADIVIHVIDASGKIKDPYVDLSGKEHIEVYNKSDLLEEEEPGKLYISALRGNVEPLLEEIGKRLGLKGADKIGASLYSARQIALLDKARERLEQALELAKGNEPVDIISSVVFSAYNDFRELLGEGATDDLSDEIFSRFCVGK